MSTDPLATSPVPASLVGALEPIVAAYHVIEHGRRSLSWKDCDLASCSDARAALAVTPPVPASLCPHGEASRHGCDLCSCEHPVPASLVGADPETGLEDAHAALASALLWLDGEYAEKPRTEFNREAWSRTARAGLAALVAARQAQRGVASVPEDGRSRLPDLASGVTALAASEPPTPEPRYTAAEWLASWRMGSETEPGWTTERQPGDDEECERLGCEDKTHPVHHRVPTLDAAWRAAHRAAEARFGEPRYIAMAGPEPGRRVTPSYRAECGMDFAVRDHSTPTAALQALAARLATGSEATPEDPCKHDGIEDASDCQKADA